MECIEESKMKVEATTETKSYKEDIKRHKAFSVQIQLMKEYRGALKDLRTEASTQDITRLLALCHPEFVVYYSDPLVDAEVDTWMLLNLVLLARQVTMTYTQNNGFRAVANQLAERLSDNSKVLTNNLLASYATKKRELKDVVNRISKKVALDTENDVNRSKNMPFNPNIRNFFDNWMADRIEHPYYTVPEQHLLAKITNLDAAQVKHYFQNSRDRRMRIIKELADSGVRLPTKYVWPKDKRTKHAKLREEDDDEHYRNIPPPPPVILKSPNAIAKMARKKGKSKEVKMEVEAPAEPAIKTEPVIKTEFFDLPQPENLPDICPVPALVPPMEVQPLVVPTPVEINQKTESRMKSKAKRNEDPALKVDEKPTTHDQINEIGKIDTVPTNFLLTPQRKAAARATELIAHLDVVSQATDDELAVPSPAAVVKKESAVVKEETKKKTQRIPTQINDPHSTPKRKLAKSRETRTIFPFGELASAQVKLAQLSPNRDGSLLVQLPVLAPVDSFVSPKAAVIRTKDASGRMEVLDPVDAILAASPPKSNPWPFSPPSMPTYHDIDSMYCDSLIYNDHLDDLGTLYV